MVNAYPISRAAGAFYQSARANGLVKVNKIKISITQDNISFKGACLRYDAIEERLIATPFAGGISCLNGGDWIVLMSPSIIFAGILVLVCLWCCSRIFCNVDDDNDD